MFQDKYYKVSCNTDASFIQFVQITKFNINLDGNPDELLVEASVGGVSCCPPKMLIYFYNNQEGLLEEFVFEEWVLGHGWRAVDIKLENKSAILTGTNTYYGS